MQGQREKNIQWTFRELVYQSKLQALVHEHDESSHAGLAQAQPEGSGIRVEETPLLALMMLLGSTS